MFSHADLNIWGILGSKKKRQNDGKTHNLRTTGLILKFNPSFRSE